MFKSLIITMVFAGGLFANAQVADSQKPTATPSSNTNAKSSELQLRPVDLKSLPRNLFDDQKHFWSAPFHISAAQWPWAVPVAFIGAGLLASDTSFERHLPTNPSTVSHAATASNAGLGALVGVGGGMFLWGHLVRNDQLRETGVLSGESGFNAFLDSEAFKYAFGRQRPFTADGRGLFFQGKDSFPSQHASISWAIASVIAHEYPGPLTEIMAYGVAGGVSAARVAGQKHFLTDAIVGSALGWYLGRQAFRSHSQYSDADISDWGVFSRLNDPDRVREPANMASPYVPLDSWIYPAMERLIGRGYIHSGDLGMRPWTRMECARLLLEEAGKSIEDSDQVDSDVQQLYTALTEEFSEELKRFDGGSNLSVSVDSIYTRMTGISGSPLANGLHFGQTIINDYGRPYGEGFNNVSGLSGHAVAGPLSFYLRAEYERAPSGPALSAAAAQAVQSADGLPVAPPTTPSPAVNRLRILEGYVGVQLNNWQITFGKQALWWGEDQSGPMLFSTNAAPILMLQINRVKPFELPSVFRVVGPIRVDYLIGRLSGYNWVYSSNSGFSGSWEESLADQPFIVGQKVSFKPTENLELGISATALFGGTGVSATFHRLLQAMFATGNGLPGTAGDPGDRRGGFDFAYRIPGLRDWLTFYADTFTDDEVNPWFSWDKTAMTSGLYLTRVPGLSKLSFRVEGIYTDPPGGGKTAEHGFFYSNARFKSGYTNDGALIGSWIGRQGQGAQAWATYWLNAKSKVELNFRHQEVSPEFIPNGGALTDFSVSTDYRLRSDLELSGWVQHERWHFPVIQPTVSSNVTAEVQITFEPHKWSYHSRAAGISPSHP